MRTLSFTLILSLAAMGPGSSIRAPSASPAANSPQMAEGQVLTPDSKPVQGATVYWIGMDPRQGPSTLQSVETDADGKFHMDAAQNHLKTNPSPMIWDVMFASQPEAGATILARAKGWGFAFKRLPSAGSVGALRLQLPSSLEIPVTDENGKAMPGIEIGVVAAFGDPSLPVLLLPWDLRASLAVTTGDDGIAKLTGLPRGARIVYMVLDDRFVSPNVERTLVTTNAETFRCPPLALATGVDLTGKVVLPAEGKPAADIRVMAFAANMSAAKTVATDVNGIYHLRGLTKGPWTLCLLLPDALRKNLAVPEAANVTVGQQPVQTAPDILLARGGVISGQALAEGDGKPVAGAIVTLQGGRVGIPFSMVPPETTGADGRFEFRSLPGRQGVMIAAGSLPGFQETTISKQVDVPDGGRVEVQIKIPRAPVQKPIHGIVLDPDGAPVEGAQVTGIPKDRPYETPLTAITDAKGAFSLDAHQVRTPGLRVRAQKGDLATGRAVIASWGDEITIHLLKNALATLSGTVVGPDQQPLPGATAELSEWDHYSTRSVASVVTDAKGAFAFASLWTDCRYSLSVSATGYGKKSPPQLELQPGEKRVLPVITLKKADSFIAGKVVDKDGAPVNGAQIWVFGQESGQSQAAAAADGKFRIENLVKGDQVSVGANTTDGRNAWTTTTAGQENIVLTVMPGAGPRSQASNYGPHEHFDILRNQPAPALAVASWIPAVFQPSKALHGKVVILLFWGIGSDSSMGALSAMEKLSNREKDNGLLVIGIHDSSATVPEVTALAKRHGITFPVGIDADDPLYFGRTFRGYTIIRVPTFAVLSRDGKCEYVGHSQAKAVQAIGRILGHKGAEQKSG